MKTIEHLNSVDMKKMEQYPGMEEGATNNLNHLYLLKTPVGYQISFSCIHYGDYPKLSSWDNRNFWFKHHGKKFCYFLPYEVSDEDVGEFIIYEHHNKNKINFLLMRIDILHSSKNESF